MSLLERLEQKAKTREEIRIETRELKRTYNTDGCYNPFNLVNPEVQRRLNQKWVRLEDVAELIRQATTQLEDGAITGESVRFGIFSLDKVCDWKAKHKLQDAKLVSVEFLKAVLVGEQTMKCPRCHKPLPTHTSDTRYTCCDGIPDICPYCKQDLWIGEIT